MFKNINIFKIFNVSLTWLMPTPHRLFVYTAKLVPNPQFISQRNGNYCNIQKIFKIFIETKVPAINCRFLT